jgi:uncharacterized membrane protein
MKHSKHLIVGAAFALAASTTPAHAQSVFSDVPDNHWAAAALKALVEAGIIVGRPAPAKATTPAATAKSTTKTESAEAPATGRTTAVVSSSTGTKSTTKTSR